MTNKDFNTLFDETVAACAEITRVKGNDYTDGEDKLYNFKKVAEFVGITPEQVWAVYAAKHFLAIMSYCRDGKVESEPINERLHDLINYAMLLKALVQEKADIDDLPCGCMGDDLPPSNIGEAGKSEVTLSVDQRDAYLDKIFNDSGVVFDGCGGDSDTPETHTYKVRRQTPETLVERLENTNTIVKPPIDLNQTIAQKFKAYLKTLTNQ